MLTLCFAFSFGAEADLLCSCFLLFLKLLYAFCALSFSVHPGFLHKISLLFVLTQFVITYTIVFVLLWGFPF